MIAGELRAETDSRGGRRVEDIRKTQITDRRIRCGFSGYSICPTGASKPLRELMGITKIKTRLCVLGSPYLRRSCPILCPTITAIYPLSERCSFRDRVTLMPSNTAATCRIELHDCMLWHELE